MTKERMNGEVPSEDKPVRNPATVGHLPHTCPTETRFEVKIYKPNNGAIR